MADRCRFKPHEVAPKCIEQAHLLKVHGAELLPRTGEATIQTVMTGGARIQEFLRLHADSTGDKLSSTVAQHSRCEDVADFLVDRRRAVAMVCGRGDPIRAEFGVGQDLVRTSAASVGAGLQRFVTAGEANPETLTKAMVTADDITKMKAMRTTLDGGAANRGVKVAEAKVSTASRNSIQLEIEEAMFKIVTAARLVFPDQPDVIELFESTLPKVHRASGKADEETPVEPPTPENKPA